MLQDDKSQSAIAAGKGKGLHDHVGRIHLNPEGIETQSL